jgi:tRNA pseudouridine38-40 synthase
MRTVLLTLAYDGTDFFGWQYQPDRRTVQHVVECAVEQVTGTWTRVTGSSRTDTGVHALGQAVSFATSTRLDDETLRRALNAVLPDDVAVTAVATMPNGFNATRDSVRKRYRYVLQDGRARDPLSLRYSWFVPGPLDVAAMQAGSAALVGEHDFAAFESTGSERESSVRTIYELSVARRQMDFGERIVVEVEANGFLYNMVRNIVGSLMYVGRAKFPPSWMAEVLASCDRTQAGMAAPPQGLFLLWVAFAEGVRAG